MRDKYDLLSVSLSPNSFFISILGTRAYQKEVVKSLEEDKTIEIEVPTKGLKNIAKEICESLIRQRKITEVLNETKTKRNISSLVVDELRRKHYKITKQNENTICDYFRKFELQLKKDKDGNLIVIDNYKQT